VSSQQRMEKPNQDKGTHESKATFATVELCPEFIRAGELSAQRCVAVMIVAHLLKMLA